MIKRDLQQNSALRTQPDPLRPSTLDSPSSTDHSTLDATFSVISEGPGTLDDRITLSVLQADNKRLTGEIQTLTEELNKQKEEISRLLGIVQHQQQKNLSTAQLEVDLHFCLTLFFKLTLLTLSVMMFYFLFRFFSFSDQDVCTSSTA